MSEISMYVALLLVGVVLVVIVLGVIAVNNRASEKVMDYVESNFDPLNSAYLHTQHLEKKKEILEQNIQILKDEYAKQTARVKEVETLKAELTSLEAKLISYQDDLERAKLLNTEVKMLQETKDRIQQMQTQLEASVKQLTSEMTQKESQLKRAQDELAVASKKLQEVEQDFRMLTNKKIDLTTEVQSKESLLGRLEADRQRSEQAAELARAEEVRLKAELATLRDEMNYLRDKRDELRVQEEKLTEQTEKSVARKAELQRLESEILRAQSELAKINDSIAKKEEWAEEAIKAKDELARTRDAQNDLIREESRLEMKCEALRKELDSLGKLRNEREENAESMELKETPDVVKHMPVIGPEHRDEQEVNALAGFADALSDAGLIFHDRT